MNDISGLDDIKLLVDTFYEKVAKDSLLGPVFEKVIGGCWEQHLDKMYRFWQTALLDGGKTYFGNPYIKHAPLSLSPDHFSHWLAIWKTTLREHFEGEMADKALLHAQRMSYVFQLKMFGTENTSNRLAF